MDAWEFRILENLKHEAKAYVRKGIPLPPRDGKYAVMRGGIVEMEINSFAWENAEIEHNKIVEIENRLDVSFGAEWREWALSLYKLDDNHNVSSSARDWKEAKTWEFSKRSSALLKIEELIQYKVYDRSRGRGDVSKDLGTEDAT